MPIKLKNLINKIGWKVSRRVLNKVKRGKVHFLPTQVSDRYFSRALVHGMNEKELLLHIRKRKGPAFFFDACDKDKIVKSIKNQYSDSVLETVNDAEKVCSHVFNMLGSGDVFLGETIDWHTDFKSWYRWNPETYYREVKYGHIDGADIIIPWELSRFHHLLPLGKAFWYTSDKKYAKEFVEQINHWIDNNPYGFGVNWACTMDVAIRIVNWIWGFYFLKDSNVLTDAFIIKFLKSMLVHGKHIIQNLECLGLHTNHYLSNLVGLIYLGLLFPEFKDARKWREFGIKELIRAIKKQVNPDGADYESSTQYHRLVTELFLSATILCLKNKIVFPDWYMKRLEKMIEFTTYYTKPDGTIPQIGDNDDGRLHILSNYSNWNRCKHNYLLSIGAVLFNRFDFKQVSDGIHEETFWLLGKEGLEKYKALNGNFLTLSSKVFPDSGFYIMRNNDLYLIVDCIPNLRTTPMSHKHNSSLSFDLYAYGKSFLIDPGSYVYTPFPEWRNQFRSTAYHNTIVVDGKEQNRFNPKRLFSMRRDTSIKINKWQIDDAHDFLDVQHTGYERLPSPVTHRRQIFFGKNEGYWLIKDILTGKGQHTIDLYFHFAPMKVQVLTKHKGFLTRINNKQIDNSFQVNESLVIETDNDDGANLLVVPLETKDLSVDFMDGWVSYNYGTKTKATSIKYSKRSQCPIQFSTILYPFKSDTSQELNLRLFT